MDWDSHVNLNITLMCPGPPILHTISYFHSGHDTVVAQWPLYLWEPESALEMAHGGWKTGMMWALIPLPTLARVALK